MSRLATKLQRLVFKISPHLAIALGVEFPLKSANRQFLEGEIFDYLNAFFTQQEQPAKCLFLGTDKRSWHYPRCLAAEVFTLDIEPKKRSMAIGVVTQLGLQQSSKNIMDPPRLMSLSPMD